MKKSVRFIAIALAFCTVFSIAAFAIQVDGVHTYNFFTYNGTPIDCHGYLCVNTLTFPTDFGGVWVWADTAISSQAGNVESIFVACTFYERDRNTEIGTHEAYGYTLQASTYDDPVVGDWPSLAKGKHIVSYLLPNTDYPYREWIENTSADLLAMAQLSVSTQPVTF